MYGVKDDGPMPKIHLNPREIEIAKDKIKPQAGKADTRAKYAFISLYLGIISAILLVFYPYLIITLVISLICGVIGLSSTKRKYAIAGIIISGAMILISILAISLFEVEVYSNINS